MQNRGVAKAVVVTAIEEAIVESTQQQMEYVRSLPLWPLRGTYWFFVRRNILANKSIEDQHQAGKIAL
jgi:hypothetical protein